MTYTAATPITVDGVRLDTLGWNLTKITQQVAGRRNQDPTVPGLDGAIPYLNDTLDQARMGLECWVRGSTPDGLVPPIGAQRALIDNLDELLHLFGKRHALLEVIEQIVPGESVLTNMIPDPGLEVLLPASSDAGVANTADAGVKRSGARSIKATTTTAQVTTANVPLVAAWTTRVKPFTTYTFWAWVRSDTASRQARILVAWRAADGVTGTTTVQGALTPLTVGAFTLVTFTATSPSTAGTVRPSAVASAVAGNAPSGEATWVDDCGVIEGTLADLTGANGLGTTFDGDTVNSLDYTTRWTGAANASMSQRVPRTARRAFMKASDTIQPDLNQVGTVAQFAVGLTVPAGVWEDVEPTSPDGTTPYFTIVPVTATVRETTTLAGATERITDALVVMKGPATTPRISDPSTGSYVQLNRNLSATEYWRVNCATWSTRVHTALSIPGTDADGVDVQALTTYGGTPNQAAFLTLTPVRDNGRRVVYHVATSTGFSAASRLYIYARRKFSV